MAQNYLSTFNSNLQYFSSYFKDVNLSLIYTAKPTYGGWVSFTSHLAKKLNANIYQISKRSEPR